MFAFSLPSELPELPDWAIPVIGVGCTLVILGFGYLIFGGKSSRSGPRLHNGPQVRIHERPPVARTADTSGQNQRGMARRIGHPVDVEVTDLRFNSLPRRGLVIDRSLRGLCLAMDAPSDVGTLLNVRPASMDDSMPWVKVEVKNCRNVQNAFELGCEFLQVPPSNILMLFG